MAATINEMAPAHLPSFLPGPDGSDPLFTVIIVCVIVGLLLIGTIYLRLHALPEQMAHQLTQTQFTLVAVLGLLALFTHQNLYWVAALVLSIIRFPDLETPLNSIAGSLKAKTGNEEIAELPEPQPEPASPVAQEGSDHV